MLPPQQSYSAEQLCPPRLRRSSVMWSVGRLPNASNGPAAHVVSTVLQLVVQNADVQLADVVRWLQLSRGIRRALRQASGNLSVFSCYPRPTADRLIAFAHWLPCHAGLVSSLELWGPGLSFFHEPGTDDKSTLWSATEQMLSLALQLSSSRAPPNSTAPQDLAPPALQLKSFKTNFMFQPAALRSLAPSLTELVLAQVRPQRFTAKLCAALGHMSALRKLDCWMAGRFSRPQLAAQDSRADPCLPTQFAAALAGLTQLQLLTANFQHGTVVPAASLCHLPATLTNLCLTTSHQEDAAAATAAAEGHIDIGLGHLTRLQKLDLTVPNGISAQSQLPACLTGLTLVGPAEAVMGMSGLQRLLLSQTREGIPFLQQVAQQAKLQQLELGLHACSPQQLQQVFDTFGSCTQLTMLNLFNRHADPLDGPLGESNAKFSVDLSGVLVPAQLGKLRQLQQLQLTQTKWDSGCSNQLILLSALTQLKLHMCDIAELGLAVMFQRLTSLRELDVAESLPANDLLLVSIGALSALQCLYLIRNNLCVTSNNLPLLAPLTNLTHLILDDPQYETSGQPAVSISAQAAFLAGMPHPVLIEWV